MEAVSYGSINFADIAAALSNFLVLTCRSRIEGHLVVVAAFQLEPVENS